MHEMVMLTVNSMLVNAILRYFISLPITVHAMRDGESFLQGGILPENIT